MAAINTVSLTKYYGQTRGIEDLNLTVEKGEVYGFLGPNGAGKTTTIRLLTALLRPTKGTASVLGKDAWQSSALIKEELGNLPGDIRIYEKMSGAEFLDFIARFRPRKPPVLKEKLIERFDLNLNKRIKDYSKGNRQKLGIVQALMHDPQLLLLDEPTSGLDPLMQQQFYAVIEEFRSRGRTIFLSSHILPEIERVCDRVGIIKEGHLVSVERICDLEAKHVRYVDVSFEGSVNQEEFRVPGVTAVERINDHLRITVKGEIDPLIKKLAQYKVKELDSSHASLEEVFLEFYEKDNTGER
ncbi:MAG: ABC transporter ATP-binding protein [Candidatus Aquicultor sp.]